MGFKRLIKKGLLGGMIEGHIFDAIQKKKETGKSFRECLSESVKETFTEDMPGTSHVYQMGKTDGTIEQAKRDEKKMQKMQEDHERDRQEWERIDKEKDELLDEMEMNL